MKMILDFLVHYGSEISAGLIAIPFAWIVLRSRSLFALRYRIWRIADSKHGIKDSDIQNAVQDRSDLIAFRMLLMRADTIGEARRIAQWAKKHDVDPGIVGECGRYFHRQDLRVKDKLPNFDRAKKISFLLTYVACWLLIFLAIFGSQDRVLKVFNDDQTHFYMSAQGAKLTGANAMTLKPADCPKTDAWDGFNKTHVIELCTEFKDPKFKDQFQSDLYAQRILLLSFFIVILGGVLRWRRHLHAVRTAHSLKKWLAFRERLNNGYATIEKHKISRDG